MNRRSWLTDILPGGIPTLESTDGCKHPERVIHPDGFSTCMVCGNDLTKRTALPVPLVEGEVCLTHWDGDSLVSYVVPAGIIRRVSTRIEFRTDDQEEP